MRPMPDVVSVRTALTFDRPYARNVKWQLVAGVTRHRDGDGHRERVARRSHAQITLPISVTLLERAKHQLWVPSRAFWAAVAVGVVVHGPVLDALFRMSLNLMRA